MSCVPGGGGRASCAPGRRASLTAISLLVSRNPQTISVSRCRHGDSVSVAEADGGDLVLEDGVQDPARRRWIVLVVVRVVGSK